MTSRERILAALNHRQPDRIPIDFSAHRSFGEKLTFWGGGCDTRFMLPSSTQDNIQKHVKEQIKTLGTGGGFIFQQVHNIMADVPVENVAAMFEAVNASG